MPGYDDELRFYDTSELRHRGKMSTAAECLAEIVIDERFRPLLAILDPALLVRCRNALGLDRADERRLNELEHRTPV